MPVKPPDGAEEGDPRPSDSTEFTWGLLAFLRSASCTPAGFHTCCSEDLLRRAKSLADWDGIERHIARSARPWIIRSWAGGDQPQARMPWSGLRVRSEHTRAGPLAPAALCASCRSRAHSSCSRTATCAADRCGYHCARCERTIRTRALTKHGYAGLPSLYATREPVDREAARGHPSQLADHGRTVEARRRR